MEAKTLQKISTQVYRQFPEMKGIKPKTRKQTGAEAKAITYTLTYQTKVETSDGRLMPRTVRVVATDTGAIIKITTSH